MCFSCGFDVDPSRKHKNNIFELVGRKKIEIGTHRPVTVLPRGEL